MDPPGVAPVAGGAGLEVEVEGGGAGDQGVLGCLHREHVQDLVTEPDIHISIGAATYYRVSTWSKTSPGCGRSRWPRGPGGSRWHTCLDMSRYA